MCLLAATRSQEQSDRKARLTPSSSAIPRLQHTIGPLRAPVQEQPSLPVNYKWHAVRVEARYVPSLRGDGGGRVVRSRQSAENDSALAPQNAFSLPSGSQRAG